MIGAALGLALCLRRSGHDAEAAEDTVQITDIEQLVPYVPDAIFRQAVFDAVKDGADGAEARTSKKRCTISGEPFCTTRATRRPRIRRSRTYTAFNTCATPSSSAEVQRDSRLFMAREERRARRQVLWRAAGERPHHRNSTRGTWCGISAATPLRCSRRSSGDA